MNYDKPKLAVTCLGPTCEKEASGIGAYQSRTGRLYCSQRCHDIDPRRDEPPVPPPTAAPRPDVPEHHRPISVGALKAGSR